MRGEDREGRRFAPCPFCGSSMPWRSPPNWGSDIDRMSEGSPEGPQLRRGSGQGGQQEQQDGFGMGSY